MPPIADSETVNLTQMQDEVLVKLAKGGKERAFEELMRRSWDRSLRLALCHLRNHDDAIDEVQSAYWKAYTHLSGFSEEAKFSTWVGRIVINRCIMRLRSSKREKVFSFDHTSGMSEGQYVRDKHRWSDPEQQVGSREVSDLVRFELRRVPKILRTAVELRHVHGMSLEEIGTQLGVSVGTVKTRVSRGNKFLRDRMTSHLGKLGVATLTR